MEPNASTLLVRISNFKPVIYNLSPWSKKTGNECQSAWEVQIDGNWYQTDMNIGLAGIFYLLNVNDRQATLSQLSRNSRKSLVFTCPKNQARTPRVHELTDPIVADSIPKLSSWACLIRFSPLYLKIEDIQPSVFDFASLEFSDSVRYFVFSV